MEKIKYFFALSFCMALALLIIYGAFMTVTTFATVTPDEKVEIMSIERRQLMFKKQYQYRVLAPDSTIKIYWSNDIYCVGDKIKI